MEQNRKPGKTTGGALDIHEEQATRVDSESELKASAKEGRTPEEKRPSGSSGRA